MKTFLKPLFFTFFLIFSFGTDVYSWETNSINYEKTIIKVSNESEVIAPTWVWVAYVCDEIFVNCCCDGNGYICFQPLYAFNCIPGGGLECDSGLSNCLPGKWDCNMCCPGDPCYA